MNYHAIIYFSIKIAIAQRFNNFFSKIGEEYASKLPKYSKYKIMEYMTTPIQDNNLKD